MPRSKTIFNPVRKLIIFPRNLFEELKRKAKREGLSLNVLIRKILFQSLFAEDVLKERDEKSEPKI